jgi:GNAT superfamily N-acetyltransferase
MSKAVVIRPATLGDAHAITGFNLRLALETEQLRLDPKLVGAGVEAVLSDPARGRYFVAEGTGEIVGQCCVTCEWSDWRNGMFWWLQSVYVAPGWRGTGVFRALFDHVRHRATAEGVIGLRLYVEKGNLSAKLVYQRAGMHLTHYDMLERMLNRGSAAVP